MNYSELRKSLRCAVYVCITLVFIIVIANIAVYRQAKKIDELKAHNLKLEVNLIDREVVIGELRRAENERQAILSSEDFLPSLNGMEIPK